LAVKETRELKFEKKGKLEILIKALPADAKQLQKVSMELSKDNTVIVLIGVTETVNIFGSAGKKAAKSGVNVGKIVSDVCKILGGKGGGSPVLGRGIGKNNNNVDKALEEAWKMVS
jgi:alanyl-tRNA synthetase